MRPVGRVALVLAVSLTACGGEGQEATTSTSTATTTPAPQTTTPAVTTSPTTATTLPPVTTTTTLMPVLGTVTMEFGDTALEAQIDDCPASQLVEGGTWQIGSLQGSDLRDATDQNENAWGLSARVAPSGFQFVAQALPDNVPTYEVSNADQDLTAVYEQGTATFTTVFEKIAGFPAETPDLTVTVTCET